MISPSQILLSAIVVFILIRTAIAYKKRNLSPIFSLLWMAFWLAGLVLIFQQRFVIDLAKKLGISRGVDLVIYLALIFIFYMIYRLLVKMEILERSLTEMVRKIAIKNVQKRFRK